MVARFPRLFVEVSLSWATRVELGQEQSARLARVLRMRSGDRVLLFNSRDGEWESRIEEDSCRYLKVEHQRRVQTAEPGPWLLFAPIKQRRLMRLVEHACELGVSRLYPVVTERTNVASLGRERVRATIIGAAEQSQRLTIPELAQPMSMLGMLSTWQGPHLLLCAEKGPAEPIARVLGKMQPIPGAILVGPEGGFAQSELDAMASKPFITFVSLGSRILRCESAALAALACWQAWVEARDHQNTVRDTAGAGVPA